MDKNNCEYDDRIFFWGGGEGWKFEGKGYFDWDYYYMIYIWEIIFFKVMLLWIKNIMKSWIE